jgi:hypothetical protein
MSESTETPLTAPPAVDVRHQVLAEAYLVHGNASQAAREAGFSKKSAHVTGCRILARPEVQEYLAFRRLQLQEEYGLSRRGVIEELKAIAHSNVEHYTVDNRGRLKLAKGAPPDAMRAVSSVTSEVRVIPRGKGKPERRIKVRYTLWSKPEAVRTASEILELVGKNAYPAAVRAAVGVAVQSGHASQPQTRVLVQVAIVAE